MTFNYLKAVIVSLVMMSSDFANAAIITIGNLTLKNENDTYVTDTIKNIKYMRWNQINSLNYSQVNDAIGPGGVLAGWSLARNAEANDFVIALLGDGAENQCNRLINNQICAREEGHNLFTGEDFVTLMGRSYSAFNSYAFFINTTQYSEERGIGYVEVTGGNPRSGPLVQKLNSWGPVWAADILVNDGIGFLLFKPSESAIVSSPSSIVLFSLGLMALASHRSKKHLNLLN